MTEWKFKQEGNRLVEVREEVEGSIVEEDSEDSEPSSMELESLEGLAEEED